MAGTSVPYRWITGLPEQAQREIERNFLALQEQFGNGVFWDAVVDPTLKANDPTLHLYTTVGAAVKAEEVFRKRNTLCIAVVPTGTTITESGSNMGSGGSYYIFCLGGSDQRHGGPVWDLHGSSFTDNGATAAQVIVRGLTIKSTTTMAQAIAKAVGG